jgi:hypothetical protein
MICDMICEGVINEIIWEEVINVIYTDMICGDVMNKWLLHLSIIILCKHWLVLSNWSRCARKLNILPGKFDISVIFPWPRKTGALFITFTSRQGKHSLLWHHNLSKLDIETCCIAEYYYHMSTV